MLKLLLLAHWDPHVNINKAGVQQEDSWTAVQ